MGANGADSVLQNKLFRVCVSVVTIRLLRRPGLSSNMKSLGGIKV